MHGLMSLVSALSDDQWCSSLQANVSRHVTPSVCVSVPWLACDWLVDVEASSYTYNRLLSHAECLILSLL